MNQPSPSLVSLIDPDPKGLATLTLAFEREGFAVAGTSDLEMARQLFQVTDARVTVLALRPPESAGLALVSEIAQAAPPHRSAVVVLGPPEARRAALDSGAVDYLDTPALVRDAIVISRLWMAAGAPAASGDGVVAEAPEISGSLDALHGLYFLMRAMNAAQRSGVLQLTRGARKGEVKFTEGAVTSAQTRALQAFPALHQLLLWTGGDINLKLRDVPKRAQFSASGTEILEECERFLRDVAHAVGQLGSLRSIFARDARHAGAQAADAPQEVAPVARLFDGARTLAEVIEESPFRIFDTLRAVKRLVDGGVVLARVVVPSPSSSAAPPGAAPAATTVAAARVRSKTSDGLPIGRMAPPGDVDAIRQDRRDTGGERRKIPRRTPSGFVKPAAKPAPAPIPLVTKKSPSGAFTAGELRPARAPHPAPGRPLPGARREPSVHVTLDPPAVSLDVPAPAPAAPRAAHAAAAPVTAAPTPASPRAPAAPAPSPARAPAPAVAASAAPLSARQAADPIRLKKVAKTPAASAPAFSALEADFFAREADLYKDQGSDSFEDLDRVGQARARPRTSTPRGGSKTKR